MLEMERKGLYEENEEEEEGYLTNWKLMEEKGRSRKWGVEEERKMERGKKKGGGETFSKGAKG